MVVSARARFSEEKTAVVSARVACRSSVSCCVTWFQVIQMGVLLQNLPATVSSAVRVVLVSRPRLRTSSSAVAHGALLTGGGAAGRNCCPLLSTNGATDPQVWYIGVGNLGGVGR